MAKQKRKAVDAAAREKLTDVQAKLAAAQERRQRIMAEGEAAVKRARQRAADRLTKATKDVERRAAKVARAEGKLLTVQGKQRAEAAMPPPPLPVVEVPEATTASPTAAADQLEQIGDGAQTSPILTPNGAEEVTDSGATDIGRNERRLLTVLRASFDEGGATFSQWLEASLLSKRTFLRARKTLVEAGMVAHNGSGPGARYALTGPGRSEADSPQ